MITEMIARHRAIWVSSILAVVFALLCTGAIFTGLAVGRPAPSPTPSAPATPTLSPTASPSPSPTVDLPSPSPSVTAIARPSNTCSIAALAGDPRLATFYGYVMNAATGEMLFDRNGTTGARPGSVLKLLTSSAALATLGPDYRIETKVLATAGTMVLVGGGDPTLSALPVGEESFYRGAAKLATLAPAARDAYEQHFPGVPITQVVLDSTLWDPADNWDPSVNRKEQTQGYMSETTALQVDGDRANPRVSVSARSTDPIGRAGAAFVAALGVSASVVQAKTPAGAVGLASVLSQPVRVLIQQMLTASDNTLAEHIARLVSLKSGQNGSLASLAQVIPRALQGYGVDTAGVVVRDGSGESELNAVSPSFVSRLMVKIMAGGQNLNIIYAALPVSGKTSSLASRFAGANAIARGAVTAKTGWMDTAYTLAGIVRAKDGTALAFAFYAIRPGISANAKTALDTMATAVFSCGKNLSNK